MALTQIEFLAELLAKSPKAYYDYMMAMEHQKMIGVVGNGGVGGGSNINNISSGVGYSVAQIYPLPQNYTASHKISVRMNWPDNCTPKGTKVFYAVEVAGAPNVFVFIVTDDFKHVVIEDEVGLFPSDQLVTPLRAMGLTI